MCRTLPFLTAILIPLPLVAEVIPPAEAFTSAVERMADLVMPKAGAASQKFTTTLHIIQAPLKELCGRQAQLAYQAPDKITISATVDGSRYAVGRDGGTVWFHSEAKRWGLIGRPDVPLFAGDPAAGTGAPLAPFTVPHRSKLSLLPTLCTFEEMPRETLDGGTCRVIAAMPTPATREAFQIPALRVELAVSAAGWPARIRVSDGAKLDVHVALQKTTIEPATSEGWAMPSREGDRIEATAAAHIERFARATIAAMDARIPVLPPPTGQRQLVATEGEGRLEVHDGLRVLFLKGTPEAMGHQHGKLVGREVRNLVERVLYGVGVGSSLGKGRWFFGEIEEAQSRLQPHMDPAYLREMDALADAVGLSRQEVRLANYFPELFHCSGFALLGSATRDGRIYHGRILDYLKGVGLEQNACIIVHQPVGGHAWVNVGYCGFTGSVTAMNAAGISMGEMGGRGEGDWDGKPMAQLIREVMERAATLDEALATLRRGPRTCEYYYVIADARARRAVGIKATPTIFEVVEPGAPHPQLSDPVADTVLLSAGDRYRELVRRARAGHGCFDAEAALALMTRPVCMTSNIHSVLFAPDTLDFWVANADSENVASHTHYRKFNLRTLLESPPAPLR